MFINNIRDGSRGWYPPHPNDPPSGRCGVPNSQGPDSSIFADVNFPKVEGVTRVAQAAFGITACPSHFNVPTLTDLGAPAPNGGPSEIRKFAETADVEDLHALFHLISDGGTLVPCP